MTPSEQTLVEDLFDRLAKLEGSPRDGDAERLIAQGLRVAPHAVYALVQTALVQDEALRQANTRIEELQAQLAGGNEQRQAQGTGFLDSMRDAVFGRGQDRDSQAGRGSVPSVRAQASSGFAPRQAQPQPAYPPQGPAPGYAPQPPYPTGPAFGGGGSFLGTAASAAAGVIGGSLLLDGIRSVFSHQSGGGLFGRDAFAGSGDQALPWGGSRSGGNDDLARDLGADRIGRSGDSDRDFRREDSGNDQNAQSSNQDDTLDDQPVQDADVTNMSDDWNDNDDSGFDDNSGFGGNDSGGSYDV